MGFAKRILGIFHSKRSEKDYLHEFPLNQLFRIVEKISYGQTLEEILQTIVGAVEEYKPEIMASILLLDRESMTLKSVAAPRVPIEFSAIVNETKIGPSVGSCGTAAYRKQLVIVDDIQNDPLWSNYKDLAKQFGFGACWSQPIFSAKGDVLGTFALYYSNPRKPSQAELMLIHSCAYITGIAIERKRSEDKRKESEARYRSLIEQASDAIVLCDEKGSIVEVNISACSLLGYTKEEILKLNSRNIILVEDVKGVLSHSLEKSGLTERNLIKKDGSVFPAEVSFNLVHVNNQIYGQAIIRDVSESKAAQHEILRLNQTLEKKVEERTDELGKANRILSSTNEDLTKALQELQSLQAQVMQAEKMVALGQLISGIAHELNTPLGAILASNENIVSLRGDRFREILSQFSLFNSEEKKIWAKYFEKGSKIPAFPNYSESKRKRKELLSVFDKKNMEANRSLVENLIEIDISLEDFENDLGSKALPELSKIIENAIAFSEIFRSSSIIQEATLKAKRVMTALKTYIYQDRENHRGEVNIPEQIDTVLTLYYNNSKESVRFTKEYVSDSIAWGVADQISQIWANLIANSLQAMNFKGEIGISSRIEGDYLRIDIEDNGPGIPKEIQANIFDSFFTTKEKGVGSGLGLNICKKILEDNGGSISFTSVPGKTVFTVKLPHASAHRVETKR
ncbi:GAF domain-containing sensor histidine kinase [Leptospira semungkisensis]|nr:PAS domain S-box protein [Leptospira semungkisensis]